MLASNRSHRLCQSCRNDLSTLWRNGFAEPSVRSRANPPRTYFASRAPPKANRHVRNVRLIQSTARRYETSTGPGISDEQHQHLEKHEDWRAAQAENGEGIGTGSDAPELEDVDDTTSPKTRQARADGLDLEGIARQAREEHGEYLPPGTLTEQELARYVRLYGEPTEDFEELEDDGFEAKVEGIGDEDHPRTPRLFRDNPDGSLEAVDIHPAEQDAEQDEDPAMPDALDEEAAKENFEVDSDSEQARAAEIAKQLGGEVYHDEEGNIVENIGVQTSRIHPLTREGKFSALNKTIFLPQSTFTGPVSKLLSEYSNKHIDEAALKLFGGPGLPSGVSTPISRRVDTQVPIALTASQHGMSEMEANAFIAALWPGVYASVLSVLVEIRKRLGTNWLRQLLTKEGGPRVLDAGAGGAAIVAWREIIRAEWLAKFPEEPLEMAPFGKATVLTGSNSLRHRAAALLENTTFLPRLPDYVHVRDSATLDDDRSAPQRKQFDIIFAPHSLWHLKEEFLRKQHVQNLWSLLDPVGGVLVLLEKGVPRGFEVIAAARDQILDRFISSPDSSTYSSSLDQSSDPDSAPQKSPGMIVAPCTNHTQCPFYTTSGPSTGRKDLCTFEQRYIRPSYLQRILKAKHRNHEDLRFSYLAVRKGIDSRSPIPTPTNPHPEPLVQGATATNAAFAGHQSNLSPESVNTLSLPRLVYPPLKRRHHVVMDVCTPSGTFERWTVPKSFSKQAHHDARKSSWGDLWALGAKTRVRKTARLGGKKRAPSKQERLAQRKEERAEQREEERLEQALRNDPDLPRARDIDALVDDDLDKDEDDDDIEDEDEDEIDELEAAVPVRPAEQEKAKDNSDEVTDPGNWAAWQAELDGMSKKNVTTNKGIGAGRLAKSRTKAGASKFSPGGIRIRQPSARTGRDGKGKRRSIGVGY